jgi:hypothetical protein
VTNEVILSCFFLISYMKAIFQMHELMKENKSYLEKNDAGLNRLERRLNLGLTTAVSNLSYLPRFNKNLFSLRNLKESIWQVYLKHII